MIRLIALLAVVFSSFSAQARDLTIEFDGKKISLITPVDEIQEEKEYEERRKALSSSKINLSEEYDYLYSTNRKLRSRIHDLEYAVMHLQETVYKLQNQSVPTQVIGYECMMSTKRHGTFTGSANTRIKAKGNTLKACEEKLGSNFYCDAQVQCEATQ